MAADVMVGVMGAGVGEGKGRKQPAQQNSDP
jgi:hypothetical protein